MKISFLLLTASTLLSGCVAFVTPQVTSTSYQSESMDIVGKASGETSVLRLFGIVPFYSPREGGHSAKAAIEQALQKAGNADELINASVDVERGTFLGIAFWETITVSGTAIKYKAMKAPVIHAPFN